MMWTESARKGSARFEQEMSKRGGRYCAAGGPNNVSCTNNSNTPGVSMHIFPKDESVRRRWTAFVRKHRRDFKPAKGCYTRLCLGRLKPDSQGTKIEEKRILAKGSVPTIDAAIAVSLSNGNPSRRESRMRQRVSPGHRVFAFTVTTYFDSVLKCRFAIICTRSQSVVH